MQPLVQGIHHVEIYVEDEIAAARFYEAALGCRLSGRVRCGEGADRASLLVECGSAKLLLTSPSDSSSPVAAHLRVHGEGIKDVAFLVSDVERAFEQATAHGAAGLQVPDSALGVAQVGACGALVHSLVQAGSGLAAATWPSIVRSSGDGDVAESGVRGLDHIAFALAPGTLDQAVGMYCEGLAFQRGHREDVNTEYSGMRSQVVETESGSVRFPLMEPVPGRRASQIDVYLQAHHGPGAQHMAFQSSDIVRSVTALAARVELLPTPAPYYDTVESRVGEISIELNDLRRHGILVDRDAGGLLLQVFTAPISARPTLFLEIIERRGAVGFGSGNIRALYESVERLHRLAGVDAAGAALGSAHENTDA